MANWIQKAIKHPGALTNRAKAHGRTVSEEIKHDIKSGTPKEKKQANLAKTLRRLHK